MGQDICLGQHCLLQTLGQWSPTDTVFWTVLTFPHDCTRAAFLTWVPHGRCWCESQVWVRLSPCRHEDWALLTEMSPLSGDEEGTLLRVTLLPPWRLTCGLSIQGCSSQNRFGPWGLQNNDFNSVAILLFPLWGMKMSSVFSFLSFSFCFVVFVSLWTHR